MAPNGYKAVTRYRDWDGKVRQVKRHGATKGAARRNLAAAIRDRSSGTSQIDINGETKLSVLSEVWFDEIKGRDLSPSTVQAYRDRLDKQILPSLGELRLRELSVGVVDRHLAAVKARTGHPWPKPPAVFCRACSRLHADTTRSPPTHAVTSAESR